MKQAILEDFFTSNQKFNYKFRSIFKKSVKADWILNRSLIPYLPLEIKADFSQILSEAQSLDNEYVIHRGEDSQGWASLAIHGISSKHTDQYKVYSEYAGLEESQINYNWTDISDRCPYTVDFLKNIFPYNNYHRVRFMRLDPGGFILPHRDNFDLNISAINISLNNPMGCEFLFEGIGSVPFSNDGSVMLIANGYKHSVWNRSNEPRYHIIIHGYPSDNYSLKFYNLVEKSYHSAINARTT